MKAAMIVAKTQRLPVIHSPDVNQNKFVSIIQFLLLYKYLLLYIYNTIYNNDTDIHIQGNSQLSNVRIDYKILETRGEGYNYTDDATIITVKRKTSTIRLPIKSSIRLPAIRFNEYKSINNINIITKPFNPSKFGVLGTSRLNDETTPSALPPMPLISRYYLPSKSLYSNTDTGVQEDDYLDYVHTELTFEA